MTTPTLVIHARDDQAVSLEEGRRLAALIPGAISLPLMDDGPESAVAHELTDRILAGAAASPNNGAVLIVGFDDESGRITPNLLRRADSMCPRLLHHEHTSGRVLSALGDGPFEVALRDRQHSQPNAMIVRDGLKEAAALCAI